MFQGTGHKATDRGSASARWGGADSGCFHPENSIRQDVTCSDFFCQAETSTGKQPQPSKPVPGRVFDRGFVLDSLRDCGHDKQAERYANCGKRALLFRCETESVRRFALPETCKSRLCPACQERLARSLHRQLRRLIGRQKRPRGYRLGLLTLTFRSTEERPTSADFRRGFRQVRKLVREFYPGKKGCGAVGVAEIGPSWNLHVHLIVLGPYRSQKALSERWLAITDNSFVVDIRGAEVKGAVGYILKYVRKVPVFASPADYSALVQALKGARRVHTFGVFYNRLRGQKDKSEIMACPFCGSRLIFDGGIDLLPGLPRYSWWARRCREPDNIPLWIWYDWQNSVGIGSYAPALDLKARHDGFEDYSEAFLSPAGNSASKSA